MNIVTIILARGGSKGVKNKNIINFCGKPLIALSIEQALNSNASEVYVSSDSEKILKISEQYGAIPIKRPYEFATDEATSESALIHCINSINKKKDLIVFLQATSPIRESSDINKGIDILIDKNYDSIFSAVLMDDLCIWEANNKELKSFNYDYKNRKRRQDRQESKQYVIENGSIYIFKTSVLEIYQNRLGGEIGFFIMEDWKKHEIDTYEDLELCKFIYKRKLK